jgi:hypothetical protein
MTAPERTRLPNRRDSRLRQIEWAGREWTVCAGFDATGAIKEVFIDGIKTGAHFDGLMDDACILLSVMLQAGFTPEQLVGFLSRETEGDSTRPASPIGAVAELLREIEAEFREGDGQ